MASTQTPTDTTTDQPVADGSALQFEQGVPRGLAHQRALAEVLITDSLQLGPDEFLLGTQLPRAHSTWSDRHCPYHDPLVTVEAGRQAGFVLAHLYYAVPESAQFISQQIAFTVTDLEAYKDTDEAPLEGVLHVRLANKQERDGALISMAFEGELTLNGTLAKTMTGGMIFLPPDDYKGMREHLRSRKPLEDPPSEAQSQPLDPALVGRSLARNVVIGDCPAKIEGESRYALLVDQRHPCFFDHPQDHVPGPLILEAYRQVAIATATRTGALRVPIAAITGCTAQFSDFAELEAQVECSASVTERSDDGHVKVSVGLYQFGTQLAEAKLDLKECP